MNIGNLSQEIVRHAEQMQAARIAADWQALAILEQQLAALLKTLPPPNAPYPTSERGNLNRSLEIAKTELDAARQRASEWQSDMRPLLDALGQSHKTDPA